PEDFAGGEVREELQELKSDYQLAIDFLEGDRVRGSRPTQPTPTENLSMSTPKGERLPDTPAQSRTRKSPRAAAAQPSEDEKKNAQNNPSTEQNPSNAELKANQTPGEETFSSFLRARRTTSQRKLGQES